MERLNLLKLNEVEGKQLYCFEISKRFSTLEILDTEVERDRAQESMRENIDISVKESLGCYELNKQYCSDCKIQAK